MRGRLATMLIELVALRFGSCSHLVTFVPRSVAVQRTVVVPTGNRLPEGGVQTTTGFGAHVSLAGAEKITVAPTSLGAPTTRSGGQVIVGACVSGLTVMVKVWGADESWPPQAVPPLSR